MVSKSRSGPLGLLKYKEEVRARNTLRMVEVVDRLTRCNQDRRWTYSEVCREAGLRSAIAIHKPWNQHIKMEIDAHNSNFDRTNINPALPKHKYAALYDENKKLVEINKKLKADRDLVLEKLAIWQAENEFLHRECDRLRKYIGNTKK